MNNRSSGPETPSRGQLGHDELARRIHSMIRAYVGQKVNVRTKLTWEDFKASGYANPQYLEAMNKVCMDAFLAIRSRKDHRDFLEYWTSTICSVPQFIREGEFVQLSQALLDAGQWESIRSLALLALSAHSQSTSKSQRDSDEPVSDENT